MKNLKIKIFSLALFLFHISLFSHSQDRVISILPELGQGFLVLDRSNNLDVSYWEITILQEVNSAGTVVQHVKSVTELWEKNYMKIESNFYQSQTEKFLLEVTGYDVARNPIVHEGPIVISDYVPFENSDGVPYILTCSAWCSSSLWAWRIEHWFEPECDCSSGFRLKNAYQYHLPGTDIYVPYYQYFDEEAFALFCDSDDDLNYYELTDCSIVELLEGVGLKMVKFLDVTTSDNLQNANGVTLTGTVYGVAKNRGTLGISGNCISSRWS